MDTEVVCLTKCDVFVLVFCEKAIQKTDPTFWGIQWLQGQPRGSSSLTRGTTWAMGWVSCPQSMGWSPWDAWRSGEQGPGSQHSGCYPKSVIYKLYDPGQDTYPSEPVS